MEGIRLNNFDDTPLYNIKAVERRTGLPRATLRAWERRYRVSVPQRTASGYRLYAERDIMTLLWLKAQVEQGLAISQAVQKLHTMLAEGKEPATAGAIPASPPGSPALLGLRTRLLNRLMAFDEVGAEATLSEAFALHPLEVVVTEVISPVLVEIGEAWHRGEATIIAEHFASAYLRRRLSALLQAYPPANGPVVMVACAPGEWHETGALVLALMLRRRGHAVLYLGQNLASDDGLLQEIRQQRPAVLCLSANSEVTAANLGALAQRIAEMAPPRPLVVFGGQVFNQHPELRATIRGVFVAETAEAATRQIAALLQEDNPQKNKR